MTWCLKVRRKDYHWIVDLYQRLNLPVVGAVVKALKDAVEERAAILEKQKLEETKRNRIQNKIARADDQAERKRLSDNPCSTHMVVMRMVMTGKMTHC